MKQQGQGLSANLRAGLRLAFVVAVAALAACGQPAPEKLMAQAKASLAKGDRNAAVIQLKNVLQQAPNDGEARLLLGQTLFEAGDYASAEKELGRALELKQPHEKVVPLYAQTLLALGKPQAVVSEVEKYKLFNPAAVAPTQTALGDAYRALGNAARARDAYAAAIAAVPGYPRARRGEAVLVAAEGRIDDALQQINEVIAADAKFGEAHAFRAELLLAKGDRAGARKALEEAIAADANQVLPRLTLIGLLADDGDMEAAGSLLESTRKVAPRDLRVTFLDASLAFRKGDTERARQQVQLVLKNLPNHVPALLLAASLDLRANQFAAAEANLRKVVAQAPAHAGARALLVQTYLRLGQPAKAKEALQPLIAAGKPSNPQLLLLAGETLLANGEVQAASAFYQEAAKAKEPQQAAARMRLGQIALATGKRDEGLKELEAAAELDPGANAADLALITEHLRRRQFDKALDAARALEKKQPSNPLTFQMYGLVHLVRQDAGAARKSFERALELQPAYLPAARSLTRLDLLDKKPEDARKRYEAMIAREPGNELLYVALAELQALTGSSPDEIRATLQRAVKANPQATSARLALIDLELRTGNAKAALAAAQEALAVAPSDPRIVQAAGVAQERAGEINQAISSYNKLAAMQPNAVQPLYRLAALYERQKETDKAIETLRRVQKISPREREVVSELVQVYLSAGRHDDALREALALKQREPKFAGGYVLEGDVRASQRDYAAAEAAFREALKLEPKANAVAVKLHQVLIANGKKADADVLAKRWVADNPKDAVMRIYLGEREFAANNLKSAAAHYQAALASEPNNAFVLNNLAWISGELNDPKALAYAERAVQLAPANASILDTYGMLLAKQGDFEKALPTLEAARKLSPQRPELRLNYAKVLIKAGRKEDARRELESLSREKANFKGKEEVSGLLKGL